MRFVGFALACILATSEAAAGDLPVASAPAAALKRERPLATTDEGGLWQVSDKTEFEAGRSGERMRAPELEAYLRTVSCKVAPEYCSDLRIYVMQRPFFNASMAPNGYMEVWSGMLLRAEDEAQLAFVLGHEITHYAERHSLQTLKEVRDRANGAMIASFALAAIGTAAAYNNPGSAQSISNSTGSLVNIVYLANIAAVFDFSRENESRADAGGYARLTRAGYAPKAGADIWKTLTAETSQSDFPKVREKEARGSIFSTHPVTSERIAALEKLSAGASGGVEGRKEYRAIIRPYLSAWLRDDLRRKDFGETLFQIERLARDGEDLGVLNFFRGEAYRLRRQDGDSALAQAAYLKAIDYPDAPAVVWRQIGESLERESKKAEAAAYYQAYLARSPDAPDKLLIAMKVGTNNEPNVAGANSQLAPSAPLPAPAASAPLPAPGN